MRERSPVSIKPKQSLGQNFLVDENIVRNIVRDIAPKPDDIVVEIGPGLGALTHELAPHPRHLIVVEIDGRAVDELRSEYAGTAVEIRHADILEVSFAEIAATYGRRLRVAGNIPYHLTSPILFKTFKEHQAVADLTVMIQREVATRITAGPGSKDYGILAVMTQFFAVPRMLFTVSRNCFYPKPDVTSAVVQLRFHETLPHDVDPALFAVVVKTAFGKRRKMLRNSLLYLPYDEKVAAAVIAEHPGLMEKRPEHLIVAEFAALTETLTRNL
jgi:16S rRNA (adenine1518-N6/adenine1519-N6)-dimethyltransferase